MPAEHILVVDDDQDIRELLADYLHKQGYRVSSAQDSLHMQSMLSKGSVDLIVLDLMLPGKDGLAICRELRAQSNIPIIMLTAKGDEMERIIGLEMGADDYLPKPFNPRELLARIKVVLRRAQQASTSEVVQDDVNLAFGDWVLDMRARHLITQDQLVVSLSGAEFQLLLIFLKHPHRILSRDYLLNATKGRDAHPFDRSIDVQVSRLRQRLIGKEKSDNTIIKTVRGEGYVFTLDVKRSES